MRAFRASARLSADDGASAAQAAPSCQVLKLILGPLDLNLLGLVVQLYGPSRNAPVTLTITSFPGQGSWATCSAGCREVRASNTAEIGALAAESFTMRDGERTIRFGEGSAAEAPDLLAQSRLRRVRAADHRARRQSAPLERGRDAW